MGKPVIFRLMRDRKPPSLILQTKDTPRNRLMARNPRSGNMESIRLSLSHDTPFVREQEGEALLSHIEFIDGTLVVQPDDNARLAFLRVHPKNGTLFYEFNPQKEAEEEFKQLDLEAEALTLARTIELSVLEGIMNVLSPNSMDTKENYEIRRAAMVYAKKHPEEFVKMTKDPDIEIKNIIRQSFNRKLMIFKNNQREIFYNLAESKQRCLVVPDGEDPYVAFEGFLMSEKGRDLFTFLKKAAFE